MIEADKLVEIAEMVRDPMSRAAYATLVRTQGADFVRDRRADCASTIVRILWSALHPPRYGELIRSRIAHELRETSYAHLSWSLSEAGLKMVVAQEFVDLDADR